MTITTELVAFIILVFGAVSGVWWRVESKVKGAEDKADKASADLAKHELHVAQTYATKAGMQEQTNQIMRAIESIGSRIDGLTERIDNIMASRTTRPRT